MTSVGTGGFGFVIEALTQAGDRYITGFQIMRREYEEGNEDESKDGQETLVKCGHIDMRSLGLCF